MNCAINRLYTSEVKDVFGSIFVHTSSTPSSPIRHPSILQQAREWVKKWAYVVPKVGRIQKVTILLQLGERGAMSEALDQVSHPRRTHGVHSNAIRLYHGKWLRLVFNWNIYICHLIKECTSYQNIFKQTRCCSAAPRCIIWLSRSLHRIKLRHK